MAETNTTEETTVEKPETTDILNTPLPMDNENEEVITPEDEPTEEAESENEEVAEESEEVVTEDVEEKPKKKSKPRVIRRLDRVKEENRRLLEENNALKQQNSQPESGEPAPENYENGINDINYIRDLSIWGGKHGYQTEKQAAEQQKQRTNYQNVRKTAQDNFDQKFCDALDKYPDLEDDMRECSVALSRTAESVQHAIESAPNAGELIKYFAEHPDEAENIMNVHPVDAVSKIGELNYKLTPGKKTIKQSKAPKPVSTLSGNKAKTVKEYDENTTTEEFLESHSIEDLD